MTLPRPPIMDGIPSPLFFIHYYSIPHNQITPSTYQMWSGNTPGWWKLLECCLHIITLPATLTASVFPLSAIFRCCTPLFFIFLSGLLHASAVVPSRNPQWRTTASDTTLNILGKVVPPDSQISPHRRFLRSTLLTASPSVASHNKFR